MLKISKINQRIKKRKICIKALPDYLLEKQNKDKDKDIGKNEIIDNDKNEDINKGKDKDTEKVIDKVINKK